MKTRIPNAGDTWSSVQKLTIALEDAVTNVTEVNDKVEKWVEDGQVYIMRNGCTYNVLGNIAK